MAVMISDFLSRKLSDDSSCWKNNGEEFCKRECKKKFHKTSPNKPIGSDALYQ
jgi:hypothetical protein